MLSRMPFVTKLLIVVAFICAILATYAYLSQMMVVTRNSSDTSSEEAVSMSVRTESPLEIEVRDALALGAYPGNLFNGNIHARLIKADASFPSRRLELATEDEFVSFIELRPSIGGELLVAIIPEEDNKHLKGKNAFLRCPVPDNTGIYVGSLIVEMRKGIDRTMVSSGRTYTFKAGEAGPIAF